MNDKVAIWLCAFGMISPFIGLGTVLLGIYLIDIYSTPLMDLIRINFEYLYG